MISAIHHFPNIVESVKQAPTLVLLCPESAIGWCDQYCQEGYNVLHIPYPLRIGSLSSLRDALTSITEHDLTKALEFGLITFGLSEEDAHPVLQFIRLASRLVAVIHYCPTVTDASLLFPIDFVTQTTSERHFVFHLPASEELLYASFFPVTEELKQAERPGIALSPLTIHTYPLVPKSPAFPLLARPPVSVVPGGNTIIDPYVLSATNLAYTRTLALLRRKLGPHFDLEKVWGEHIKYEFEERDAIKTIGTMVEVPYVNHIPTMTGGVGKVDLTRFYKYHFTSETVTPPDTELITVSRTVGADRIIDEMIFSATHTCEIDYFLPGIKPTGKKFEVALVGVIAFRGDKLFFEHIYWDQASVLVQLGLLEAKGLPVAGRQVAKKVLDPFGMPSNTLLTRWEESEGLSIE